MSSRGRGRARSCRWALLSHGRQHTADVNVENRQNALQVAGGMMLPQQQGKATKGGGDRVE